MRVRGREQSDKSAHRCSEMSGRAGWDVKSTDKLEGGPGWGMLDKRRSDGLTGARAAVKVC